MKCTQCGADSSVLDTRPFKGMLSRRRRECFNGHIFLTVEVPLGALWQHKYDAIINGTKIRAKAYKLRTAVLRSSASNSDAARQLGVTETRVRQIRKQFATPLGDTSPSQSKETP